MLRHKLTPWVAAAICAAAVTLFISGLGRAQPGTETDPVVSLSYLDKALALSPVVLEGGEDLKVACGREIALLDGSCRLSPPEGRCWILDVSGGEVLSGTVEMTVGHVYIPICDAGADALFTLQARQSSTVAIPGGTGK